MSENGGDAGNAGYEVRLTRADLARAAAVTTERTRLRDDLAWLRALVYTHWVVDGERDEMFAEYGIVGEPNPETDRYSDGSPVYSGPHFRGTRQNVIGWDPLPRPHRA